MSTTLTPQWHHNNCPSMYGDRQDDYNASVRGIVAAGAERIRTAKTCDKVDGLFKEIVDWMGEERAAIAQRHNSPDKERFGVRRNPSQLVAFTPLYAHTSYITYGRVAIRRIASLLLDDVKDAKLEESVNGTKTKVRCRVYSGEKLREKGAVVPGGRIPNVENWSEFKKEKPKQYKVIKLAHFVDVLDRTRPQKDDSKKTIEPHLFSHTVEVVKLSEMDKKMVAIGGMLTRGLHTNKESLSARALRFVSDAPVHTFTATTIRGVKEGLTEPCGTPVLALHTDASLLPLVEKEMARLFAQAVFWKSHEGDQALKDTVAELRYLFANAMPFERGSGAIGEWLELSIYHAHGFVKARHKEETNGDMSALSSLTLSQFLLGYPLLIELGERVV